MSPDRERPAPPDYGQLPEEGAAQQEYYDRAMQALNKDFAQFLEHLEGHNKKTIEAMYAVMHWMLYEDYRHALPEHAGASEIDGISYDEFQQNLTSIEQYIKENKAQH